MKKFIFPIVTFLASVTCFSGYKLIGQKILSDGTLVEPFYLIPCIYMFLALTVISMIKVLIKNKKNSKHNFD